MLQRNKKNSKYTDSRNIIIKKNTPLIGDVINIINDYVKLDEKQIQRAKILDMNAASSYSFFKSTIKRGNHEWAAAIVAGIMEGGGLLVLLVILSLPITYGIPILLKASVKKAARKKTYFGEDIILGLEKLEKLDIGEFNAFINLFIEIAEALPTHNNFIFSVKVAFIYDLKKESSPSDKLEIIEKYLKEPSNSQSKLYKILVDRLLEIPDHSNISSAPILPRKW